MTCRIQLYNFVYFKQNSHLKEIFCILCSLCCRLIGGTIPKLGKRFQGMHKKPRMVHFSAMRMGGEIGRIGFHEQAVARYCSCRLAHTLNVGMAFGNVAMLWKTEVIRTFCKANKCRFFLILARAVDKRKDCSHI